MISTGFVVVKKYGFEGLNESLVGI